MSSNIIRLTFTILIAGFAAIYLGIAAATAQLEAIAWVAGTSTLALCIWLGRKIYLIIPILTTLGVVLPLPGFFPLPIIAQILFIIFFVLLFLLRRVPLQLKITRLEIVCFILVLTVVQTYLRNPVGLNLLGSGAVGGRPYFLFSITTVAAFFLSILTVPPKEIKNWAFLSFLGAILNFSVGLVGKIFPSVGMYLGATFATDLPSEEASDGPGRITFVRILGISLATWAASRISPLKALLKPSWFVLIFVSVTFAAISGYRSQFGLAILILLAGVYYHDRFGGLLVAAMGATLVLLLLALINAAMPLPPNIQRSLSFLPGTWDKQIVQGAEGSTEWRVEMWKDALLTDYWIKNKTLGDGLGFTKEELDRMQSFNEAGSMQQRGSSGLSIQQENMMISGGYHSGPVQTVRTTGYVGLVVLWLSMIMVAIHGHILIRRSWGTEWQASVLFICLPLIVYPFFWAFVFGTFDKGVSSTLLGAAIIRLMERNLPLSVWADRRETQPMRTQQRMMTANAELKS
jgi:hypothetical protein